MKEAIINTKKLIAKQLEAGKVYNFDDSFSEYQKVYSLTNENLDSSLAGIVKSTYEQALTVLGSGDQVFNLLAYGILDIDTFDTNKLTEYFAFGLKAAAIRTFSYIEYLEFMTDLVSKETSFEKVMDYITVLLPNMDLKYRIYWLSIRDFYYREVKLTHTYLPLFQMTTINRPSLYQIIHKNKYLENEETYNQVRINLLKAKISFANINCFSLPTRLKKEYDLVLLSNIADYFYKSWGYMWKYEELREYSKNMEKHVRKDGVLALAYLYRIFINRTQSYLNHLIITSSLTLNDLENEEIISFPHIEISKTSNTVSDALILKRK